MIYINIDTLRKHLTTFIRHSGTFYAKKQSTIIPIEELDYACKLSGHQVQLMFLELAISKRVHDQNSNNNGSHILIHLHNA